MWHRRDVKHVTCLVCPFIYCASLSCAPPPKVDVLHLNTDSANEEVVDFLDLRGASHATA